MVQASVYDKGIRETLIIKKKYIVAVVAFAIALSSIYNAINYSLKVPITSDGFLEYQTFMSYVQAKVWYPMADNLLSACLTTTYFPSLLVNVFGLEPETTFRVTLAVLVAGMPVIGYLAMSKYSTPFYALLGTLIILTSYYYLGFITYARITIALGAVFAYLWAVNSKNWWVAIPVSLFALVLTHYATAIQVIAILVIGSIGYMVFKRERDIKPYVSVIFIIVMAVMWFTMSGGAVLHYAGSFISHTTRDGIMPLLADTTGDKGVTGYQLAVMAGFHAAVIIWMFVKRKTDYFTWLYIGALITAMSGLFVPFVEQYYGQLRAFYVLMPFALIAIARYLGDGFKWQPVIPAVFYMVWFH